jgi:hypothetical protein
MDSLDPARTALLVLHMAKGGGRPGRHPFNRLFRQRAEKTGIIGVQARLLDGFRAAKANELPLSRSSTTSHVESGQHAAKVM